jgi:hypothetical protein
VAGFALALVTAVFVTRTWPGLDPARSAGAAGRRAKAA